MNYGKNLHDQVVGYGQLLCPVSPLNIKVSWVFDESRKVCKNQWIWKKQNQLVDIKTLKSYTILHRGLEYKISLENV